MAKKRNIIIMTQEEKRIRTDVGKNLLKEIKFPSSVYSYIKGKSVKSAIEDIKGNINHYTYFMKIDITNYFNSINKDKLLSICKKRLSKKIVDDIETILTYDSQNYSSEGIIIGSPLSNYLSNLYLIEFDEYMEGIGSSKYYRFSDDILILYDFGINEKMMEEKLKEYDLEINKEKLFVGSYGDSIKYLGDEILKDNKIEESKQMERKENNIKVDIMSTFKNKSCDIETIRLLEKYINENLSFEYKYLFRYRFNDENKEDLIEEMLDENLYKEIYKFNILLEEIEDCNSYKTFKNLFLKDDYEHYKANMGENIEYESINDIINENDFINHINGKFVLATRLNCNEKTDVLVLDIDNKNNLTKAKKMAIIIKEELLRRGFQCYIEFSGNKGYHIWLFFTKFIDIEVINSWIENILDLLKINKNHIEIRPKYNKISYTEELIKLPLGLHPKTKNRCEFIDIDIIEEIVQNNFNDTENEIEAFWGKVYRDFNVLYDIARECSIMKDIIEYGIRNKHINHFNRLILSYIFPKVENGREFIHLIMEQLSNYSYNITNRFIDKSPEHPISCNKLKSYFKNNKIKCCECIFEKGSKYNTPILHCKNNEFIKETIKKEAREIINEFMILKEQKKEIDLKLSKLDKRLELLYLELGDENLETSMGVLKKERNRWIIEIGV